MQFILFICIFLFFSCSSVANKCIIVDVKNKSAAEEVSNCMFFQNIRTNYNCIIQRKLEIYLQGKKSLRMRSQLFIKHLNPSFLITKKFVQNCFALFCNVSKMLERFISIPPENIRNSLVFFCF